MGLLNDDLTLWEIGFRWAGHDPDQIRLRLPLPVKDNFRVLMDAILCGHLHCMTLQNEKYRGDDAEIARFHIRWWLGDVEACIEGQRFKKELLQWARIERFEFQQWCGRHSIPLPDFWFPSGWTDYHWPESHLIEVSSEVETNGSNAEWENPGHRGGEDESADKERPILPHESEKDSQEKLRENQRRAIAVQVVAANLWKVFPEMTITEMIKHDAIQNLCGGAFQVEEVVRRWIRAAAPEWVKNRRGRPRKKGTGDS